MKVRIEMPVYLTRDEHKYARQEFVDEILMWAMETELDADFYAFTYEREYDYRWGKVKKAWAVFTVETDSTFMFTLKWGALMHKDQNKVAQ
jgi:hypothetical protein